MKFIKINLITLGATFAIYGFILRPKKSPLNAAINAIPFFQQQKGVLFTEVGKEVLKIVATYFVLQTIRIK